MDGEFNALYEKCKLSESQRNALQARVRDLEAENALLTHDVDQARLRIHTLETDTQGSTEKRRF